MHATHLLRNTDLQLAIFWQDVLVDNLDNLPEVKAINEKYDWLYKYLTEKTGANITR